ncbi:hypothetical protein BH09VER1_BH09VER1_48300 [soil metagenome]
MLPRLFVIGDSISIQYGPYLETLLAGKLSYDRKRDTGSECALADLNIAGGANGGDSSMVLAYLRHRHATDPLPADYLLLNCGLHDIKTHPATRIIQVPLDQYQENLTAILAEAHSMGLGTLWVRNTPVIDEIHNSRSTEFHRHAADVATYNAAADTIMRAAGIPLLDLHTFSQSLLPAAFIDHVHYSEEARQKQATFLAGEILRHIQQLP